MTNYLATERTRQDDISDDSDSIDLLHLWRVLMRFKKGIIGIGLLCAIFTGLVVMGMEDVYESTTTLMIEGKSANVISVEQIYGLEASSREYFSTQFELLKGRGLAQRVVRELDLLNHPEFRPEEGGFNWRDYVPAFMKAVVEPRSQASMEQREMQRVLNAFSNRLTVEPVRNTDLVNVTFEAEDPQLAADAANALANAYILSFLEQRLASTQQANAWMSGRLEDLKTTLDQSEQRLQQYLETENLVNIQGVTSLNAQVLDELTTQSVEARRARAEAETLYRQASQLRDSSADELMTVPAILNHPSLESVIKSVNEVDRTLAELSQRYGRNHPRMIALQSEKEEVRSNFERQVRQVLASIESTYRAALDNEVVTLARLEEARQEFQVVNRKNMELRELERAVDTNRELYDMFFTRIRETDETDDFQNTNAVVVDEAVPAINPSKPRRKLIVAIALAAGLMLGTGLAFLRDMLDNTIHSPADIEERLHATTLGLVPLAEENRKHISDAHGKTAYLGFMDDNKSSFSEAFRTLRTGIMLSSLDEPYKTISVTSSVPNEGKTTLALNLAAVMGQMHKTLLIDADMRRPSLAKSVGIKAGSPGLSNYIAGTEELRKCIYNYDKGGFSIMPGGQIAPNPLELIASPKFKEMLAELSEHYEKIIIDTPPTQAVSDALILGSYTQASIYVVKADSTPINAIRNGINRLQYANVNVVGVVLNQVDTTKQSNYYYYGGYYDSYGYSKSET